MLILLLKCVCVDTSALSEEYENALRIEEITASSYDR